MGTGDGSVFFDSSRRLNCGVGPSRSYFFHHRTPVERRNPAGLGRGSSRANRQCGQAVCHQRTSQNAPLLVFFALLGGVRAFGVLGLFIGPVVLSLTLVVFEMLREENAG
jgi:hypothetical protein